MVSPVDTDTEAGDVFATEAATETERLCGCLVLRTITKSHSPISKHSFIPLVMWKNTNENTALVLVVTQLPQCTRKYLLGSK